MDDERIELAEDLLELSLDDIEALLREPTLSARPREIMRDLWRQKMAIRTKARSWEEQLRLAGEFRREWGREPTKRELERRTWMSEGVSQVIIR